MSDEDPSDKSPSQQPSIIETQRDPMNDNDTQEKSATSQNEKDDEDFKVDKSDLNDGSNSDDSNENELNQDGGEEHKKTSTQDENNTESSVTKDNIEKKDNEKDEDEEEDEEDEEEEDIETENSPEIEEDEHDEEYWKERKSRYILSVDPKIAKQKDSSDTYKRFQYLLSLTDLFRYFIGMRAKHDKTMKKLLKSIDNTNNASSGTHGNSNQNKDHGSRHHRKSEKEEDAELMREEEGDDENNYDEEDFVTESPSFVKSGTLRDYQIQGLNWLISLHENKLSGILADEMGLGKTLQTISFLGYLRYVKKIDGPFLVIVPKSTLDNWRREFNKWTPDVNVLILHGDKEKRHNILQNKVLQARFDVLVTSYEMIIREKNVLKKVAWQYLIIDEAHRIKNEQSSLSQIIRLFYSKSRLLITGTPLQNNLHELWALLNFLLPDVFGDSEVFDEWFEQNNSDQDQEVVVQQLHAVLNPFLLRRIKADVEKSLLPKIETNVYVGMTDMQIKWYKSLLEKDIDAVNGAVGKREGKTRLLNIVMQLRKCCNHPYLFEGAEPGPPYTTDEHLVFNSGKMIVLDKLLKRLKEKGSRVLIFSQMSRLLDILEDYCFFREYEYCRIDGSTSHEERIEAIDDYNSPDSNKFVFLLTTRAGGLGINLVTADTVVLFDSDWNPQADLQAMDRAHRIGQKKQVHVYRFVTENAIEEKVIERAAQKLRLDQLVIQQGTGKKTANIGNSKDDLLDMIQYGAKDMFDNGTKKITVDDDIDEILKKGEERTQQLNAKFQSLGLDDLQKYNGIENQSAYEWNGKNFQKKDKDKVVAWINPSRRERRREQQTYSVDDYYKEIIGGSSKSSKGTPQPRMPRAPKIVHGQDYQFYPKRVDELQEKEQLYFKKKVHYKVTSYDVKRNEEDVENDGSSKKKKKRTRKSDDSDDDESEDDSSNDNDDNEEVDDAMAAKIKEEQDKIDNAEEYTDEDETEKQELILQAYNNWTKRDFLAFISACAKYGRTDMKNIKESIDSKTPEEVEEYAAVFWERYTDIAGYERYLTTIENGERKFERLRYQENILKMKVQQYEYPQQEMIISYAPNNARKVYNSMEDKFILIAISKIGLLDSKLYDKVKQAVVMSDLFTFDWFMRTRTVHELSKRAHTLLGLLVREYEGQDGMRKRKGRTNREDSNTPSVAPTPSTSVHPEFIREDVSVNNIPLTHNSSVPEKKNTIIAENVIVETPTTIHTAGISSTETPPAAQPQNTESTKNSDDALSEPHPEIVEHQDKKQKFE
ncbi:similar to Saccharomyces cerevisiae YOR304W ISW2 ATP-dependent DNA translocase involved in chromatin remodeling [Maudiozyma saulgeensis]|uniref:Similar to Saccharomyces cerevisiae YOR304W ISW2 ATP-dependent DNA translocase involved in chromatin remodeling n=1 Tax=Maudiozyma saulgeensis TaxID=1789683 RepID=A0A1X7R4B7_9SACH|nr:similar to Saccharomyces cerevisiae YOR304W ISW2 ATP-dependent DNA translocase involved in chromatin remodeling [Kazachstania saulgeensis]